jgi:hypothetical protein
MKKTSKKRSRSIFENSNIEENSVSLNSLSDEEFVQSKKRTVCTPVIKKEVTPVEETK